MLIFFQLLGASSLTVVALCLTFVLYICRSLGPIFSLIVNMALLILWSLGLGLLGWNMSGTLGHVCNKDNWGSWMGIMVCRLYKALFSFTVIGWVSLVALVILDFRARSKQKKQGLYNQMGAPVGGKGTRLGALGLGGFSRNVETKGVQDQAAEPLRVPEGGYDGHTYDNGSHVKVDQFGGYQPPADQTRYDSGGYDAVARH